MIGILLFASVALMCQSQPLFPAYPSQVYVRPAPVRYVTAPVILKQPAKPYSFGYNAPATGGGSSRHESSDGNGRVVGQYTVSDADGRLRVVDYYADETGFHANVKTNEPGTANQDSADVSVQSYASPVVHAPAKVVAAPARYVARPVYSVPAPVRRVISPVPASYRVVPAHNSFYTPVTYGSHSPYYAPYTPNLAYYK